MTAKTGLPAPSQDAFTYEHRGATWIVSYKDRTAWPIMLIARHVYHGTDRLLATLTLARQDNGSAKSTLILTSKADLLVATRRNEFARESSRRLKPTVESSIEAVEQAISHMVDSLLEHLLSQREEIEIISAVDIEVPDDLTPPYQLWPIVPASRPGMLVAPSGSGKSGSAAAMGLAVVTGKIIIPRLDPRVQGPVVYVGQEETPAQWKARIMMICRGIGIEVPRHYFYVKLPSCSLIESQEMLAEQLATRNAAMVIIDSAQATWGSEGDGIRDWATRWYNAVDYLGVPTLVVEHPNLQGTTKPNQSGFAAGTSVKRDRVGHAWAMKSVEIPSQDEGTHRYHVTLLDAKRNYVAKQPDIIYEVVIHKYEWSRFIEAEAMTAATVVDSASKLDDVLASVMRDSGEEHPDGWTVADLASRLKLADDRRLRQSLRGPFWRPAGWNKGLTYRFDQVEGTGSNHIKNPARYTLGISSPDAAPGDNMDGFQW